MNSHRKSLVFSFFISAWLCGASPAHAKKVDLDEIFKNKNACFILYDMKKDELVKRHNESRCAQREPACSTFKVPLALIAFDKGVLQDENTSFQWTGGRYSLPAWEGDQTAASWMRESVVWVSQRIAPQLGQETIESYLAGFDYGTHDLSSGLTTAWLTSGPPPSLLISADEQAEFFKKWWRGKLPVSKRASELTEKITYLETSPKGYALHGKTGSGLDSEGRRIGWFVAHLQKGKKEYVAVVSFTQTDSEPPKNYAGLEAKAMMKDILGRMRRW